MATKTHYVVHALRQIRRTLDGSQPKDPAGAVMALDHLIRVVEENAIENRQTRRKWVKQFAQHVLAATHAKKKRDRWRKANPTDAMGGHYERSRRYHASRAGDFAHSLIEG